STFILPSSTANSTSRSLTSRMGACMVGITAAPFSMASMMCIGLVEQVDGRQRLSCLLGFQSLFLHLGIEPEQAAAAVGVAIHGPVEQIRGISGGRHLGQ